MVGIWYRGRVMVKMRSRGCGVGKGNCHDWCFQKVWQGVER